MHTQWWCSVRYRPHLLRLSKFLLAAVRHMPANRRKLINCSAVLYGISNLEVLALSGLLCRVNTVVHIGYGAIQIICYYCFSGASHFVGIRRIHSADYIFIETFILNVYNYYKIILKYARFFRHFPVGKH